MRNGSRHEDLKGDTVALAKLVMKEGEKPGKFLLPHGMILLCWWLRMFMEDNPYGIQNQSSFRIMELSVELGYATRRQQENLRELQSSDVGSRSVHEAPLIMVAEKRDEHLRARIQMIACQRHRHLSQRFALGESATQRTE